MRTGNEGEDVGGDGDVGDFIPKPLTRASPWTLNCRAARGKEK